jgi:phytoene dehydrogenase-like protein
MRRFILYVALCLGCAFAPCLNVASAARNESEASAPLDEDKYQAYVEKIAEATREYDAGPHAPQYPPSGKSFDELAAAAAENIDFCIRYLAEGKDAGREKLIALYSMYKLDVDDYVVFIRKLAKLYHSGLLPPRAFSGAIYYRYSVVAVERAEPGRRGEPN